MFSRRCRVSKHGARKSALGTSRVFAEAFRRTWLGRRLALYAPFFPRRQALRSRHYDDWTIESWRIDPRLRALETDIDEPDQTPPLWKDLTLASIQAAALCGAAAMLFA